MELAARIRWNSLFSLLSSGIRLFTNVFLFLGLARFYGPEAFGQFATAHTLSTLILLLADFGLDLLFTTEVARQRSQAGRLFQSFAALKLLFVGVAVAVMWLIPVVHTFSAPTRVLIYVFSFGVACNAGMNFFFALFKGFEQLHHETRISFVANSVLLALLILLGILRAPIWVLATVFAGARALGLILAAVKAARLLPLQAPKMNAAAWKEVMRQGWVFGVYLLCGTLFFQLDALLLAFWQGDYAVGIYQSVMKLVALVLALPEIANSVFLPLLSRYHDENKEKWERIGRLLNKTLWLCGLPIGLVFFVYGEPLIRILYGTESFAPAIPLMRVAALIVVLRFAWEAYGLMLTTSGRQFEKMIIVVAATVLTLALNAYAIPRHGVYGAAIVALITNSFVAAGYALCARIFFVSWTLEVRYLLPGAMTLVLGLVLWSLPDLSFGHGLLAAVAFYALIFYFAGYTKDERQIVFGWRKKQIA
ncbi:flippase [bacterium]|nr:flippase [bacterium]